MRRGAAIYAIAGVEVRRQLNRAFFARIEVDTDEERVALAEPWREVAAAAHQARQGQLLAEGTPQRRPTRRSPALRANKTNPDLVFAGQGSNMNPLVELRGFEPLTPSMRTTRRPHR